MLGPLVNRRFLPCRMRGDPFPYRINFAEIVHLVKSSDRRGSFTRKGPDSRLSRGLRPEDRTSKFIDGNGRDSEEVNRRSSLVASHVM